MSFLTANGIDSGWRNSVFTQTFSLVDQNWQSRDRIRRLLRAIIPLGIAVSAIVVELRVWMATPRLIDMSLELWAVGGACFAAIFVVSTAADPVAVTVTPSELRFSRQNGSHFTVRLDRPRIRVTLNDQMGGTGRPAMALGSNTPYFGTFSQIAGYVPLSAEAYAGLQRELPRIGFTLMQTGPIPPGKWGTQLVFRKNAPT